MAGLEDFKRTFTIIIIIKDWTMLVHSTPLTASAVARRKNVKACHVLLDNGANKINRACHRNRFANFSILD